MQERPYEPGDQAQPHEADVPDQGVESKAGHLPGQQQTSALRPLLLQRPAIVVKDYLKWINRIRHYLVISHQTWLVCSEQALATVRQVRSLNFHRDLETRNSTEVASVCRKASSPYSFHRNVTVATLSMMTITAVTMRNTCNEELNNSDQLADI